MLRMLKISRYASRHVHARRSRACRRASAAAASSRPASVDRVDAARADSRTSRWKSASWSPRARLRRAQQHQHRHDAERDPHPERGAPAPAGRRSRPPSPRPSARADERARVVEPDPLRPLAAPGSSRDSSEIDAGPLASTTPTPRRVTNRKTNVGASALSPMHDASTPPSRRRAATCGACGRRGGRTGSTRARRRRSSTSGSAPIQKSVTWKLRLDAVGPPATATRARRSRASRSRRARRAG